VTVAVDLAVDLDGLTTGVQPALDRGRGGAAARRAGRRAGQERQVLGKQPGRDDAQQCQQLRLPARKPVEFHCILRIPAMTLT